MCYLHGINSHPKMRRTLKTLVKVLLRVQIVIKTIEYRVLICCRNVRMSLLVTNMMLK